MDDDVQAEAAAEAHDGDVLERIFLERRRQRQDLGYDAEHDDMHDGQQIAWAATCYAAPDEIVTVVHGVDPFPWDNDARERVRSEPGYDRVRELIKAAALLVAEIERIERAAAKPAPSPPLTVWSYATEAEVETLEGSCASREEAIAAAPGALGLDPGEEFFVFECRRAAPDEFVNADDVLDVIESHVDEQYSSEATFGFPRGDVSENEAAELDALLERWCRRTLRPNFWRALGEAERHVVPEREG